MFDNLKEQIRKENLQIIKKKSRYIQHQIQKNQKQTKINKTLPQLYNMRAPFLNQIEKKKLSNDHDESMSSDSLSDYELQEREQMFNLLVQKDMLVQKDNQHYQERSNQSSPLYKTETQFKIFSQTYFTPQTKIKQLQRTVQLSQQKLKLTQQSHIRQIDSLNHKHSLTVQEMNLKIQKLQLIVKQQSNRTQRINELQKENRHLRQTLQVYQQKYWQYQQLSTLLNRTQQQKQKIILQNNQLKNTIKLTQTFQSNNKQNQSSVQNSKNIQQSEMKTKQLERQISRLQNKITQIQRQCQLQKTHNQQIITNYQLKIQHLQSQLKKNTKTMRQSQLTISKLNEQKDKLQKSLLFTMESFSKHLVNQSTSYMSLNQYRRCEPQQSMKQKQKYRRQGSSQNQRQKLTQSSIKPVYKIQSILQQETINLDLNQSSPNPTHTSIYPTQINKPQRYSNKKQQKPYNQLNSISPLPIKTTQNYQNTTQYLSYHDYLKNQQQNTSIIKQSIQHKNQRSRIMSHQPSQNKYKLSKFIALQNLSYQAQIHDNPQKENTQQSKIAKLQKKLQIANMKIVQLLKEKLQKGTKLTFK